MKYRTENNITNRKVVTASVGGGLGAAIGTIFQYIIVSSAEKVFHTELTPEVREAIFYIFMVFGSIGGAWVSGYTTRPAPGDGIVKE